VNAREEIAARLWLSVPSSDDDEAKARAEQMLNAHRDEVRTGDARLLEDAACDADWTRTPDYCAGLRAAAELLLANTEKATAAAATATPEFFQAGLTYQRGRWQFQCLAVAPNPFNGETRAVGFLHRPGEPATATALDPDDWAHGGWADITKDGSQ
jgi:hypothetical protein